MQVVKLAMFNLEGDGAVNTYKVMGGNCSLYTVGYSSQTRQKRHKLPPPLKDHEGGGDYNILFEV